MSAPRTVMFSCAGGTTYPALMRRLREHSRLALRLAGVNAGPAPEAEAILDYFAEIPLGSDDGYLDALEIAIQQSGAELLILGSDDEAMALAPHHERLAKLGCKVFSSPEPVLNLIASKLKTYEVLQSAGIRVPTYAVRDDPQEIAKMILDYGYPDRSVIIKPIAGRGGRGLNVFIGADRPPAWMGAGLREKRHDKAEVTAETIGAMIEGATMVMPCLGTPVYDADVSPRRSGEPVVVVRERINPAGIPWEGNVIVRNPEIEAYVRDVVKALKLTAMHDIDLMTDAEGRPALLEVNPRYSGSIVATELAGVSFLDAAIADQFGIDLPVELPSDNVTVLPE